MRDNQRSGPPNIMRLTKNGGVAEVPRRMIIAAMLNMKTSVRITIELKLNISVTSISPSAIRVGLEVFISFLHECNTEDK
jgi:hypothetical protein